MDIDEALTRVVGEYGPAQRRYFWVLVSATMIPAMQTLHMVYIGAEPKEFLCAHGPKQSQGCPKAGETCAQYLFPPGEFTSIVSEWSLVCDQSYKVGMVQTAFMIGVIIGTLIFAAIADAHGRRPCLYGSLGALLWCTLAGAYAPTYYIYLLIRFIAGLITGGWNLVSFIMATELIGPSIRGFCGIAFPAAFATGICAYSAMAYFLRDWRLLSLGCTFPCLIGFFFYWSFPESPRWLLAQGKVKEATRLLEAITVANYGKPPKVPIVLKTPSSRPSGSRKSEGTFKNIAFHPKLRTRCLISCISSFVSSAVYYGMTMSASTLGQNIYLSVSLSGFIELPAYLVALSMIDSLGRRLTFSGTFFFTALPCFMILFKPLVIPLEITNVGPFPITVALGLLGKMAVSIASSVCFLYVAELFPTSCRNNGVAIATMFARVGAALVPLLLPISQIYPSLEYGVYGASSLVCGFLALILPETVGQPLPETISDVGEGDRVMEAKATLLVKT